MLHWITQSTSDDPHCISWPLPTPRSMCRQALWRKSVLSTSNSTHMMRVLYNAIDIPSFVRKASCSVQVLSTVLNKSVRIRAHWYHMHTLCSCKHPSATYLFNAQQYQYMYRRKGPITFLTPDKLGRWYNHQIITWNEKACPLANRSISY